MKDLPKNKETAPKESKGSKIGGGLDALFKDNNSVRATTDNTYAERIIEEKEKPKKETLNRHTFFFEDELILKIKQLKYWDRRETITEIVNDALLEVINEYEKKNGILKPIPESKKKK
jgi:hypothetical protein